MSDGRGSGSWENKQCLFLVGGYNLLCVMLLVVKCVYTPSASILFLQRLHQTSPSSTWRQNQRTQPTQTFPQVKHASEYFKMNRQWNNWHKSKNHRFLVSCGRGAVGQPRKAHSSFFQILCLVNFWQREIHLVRHLIYSLFLYEPFSQSQCGLRMACCRESDWARKRQRVYLLEWNWFGWEEDKGYVFSYPTEGPV